MSDKFKYTAGLNNVGSYQVAGSPYVSASIVAEDLEEQISFPRVTNSITVKLNENIYNSVSLEGPTIHYVSASPQAASDGDSRTITTWINTTINNTSNNEGIVIGGTNTTANRFCIREKGGKLQALLYDSDNVKSIVGIVAPAGWFHLAFVVDSGNSMKVFINNVQQGTTVTIADTVAANLGGGLILGPPANGDGTYGYRDSILWNTALTDVQIENLYNARNDYRDPAFSVAEKLVWIKPTEAVAVSPVNTLINSGNSTYGNMTLTGYVSPEEGRVVVDSPFGTGNGELRIHYRSTGSLHNVVKNKNYWKLDTKGEEIKMNVKSKEIYLSTTNGDCDFSIQAGLTNISTELMYEHTGSGVDE